jgi:hypothetical protein
VEPLAVVEVQPDQPPVFAAQHHREPGAVRRVEGPVAPPVTHEPVALGAGPVYRRIAAVSRRTVAVVPRSSARISRRTVAAVPRAVAVVHRRTLAAVARTFVVDRRRAVGRL